MDKYSFDDVDFDIEIPNDFMKANPGAVTFFQTLHQQLSSEGKTATLTLLGDLKLGPAGTLAPLFKNFSSMFDGVNLMLYDGGTHYYIDKDNESWGLKQWLSYLPDPSVLHIGFFDDVPYENPDASAGEKYDIPSGLSRGQSAAWIYKHVLDELGLKTSDVGEPFWWTNDPTKIGSDQVIQDFNDYLNSH